MHSCSAKLLAATTVLLPTFQEQALARLGVASGLHPPPLAWQHDALEARIVISVAHKAPARQVAAARLEMLCAHVDA